MKIRNIKLFCLDDHRNFSEEIRKKFDDDPRYSIFATTNKDEFIKLLSGESPLSSVIIPIVALHNNREQIESINQIFRQPRMINFIDSVIILVPADKFNEISLESTIKAYSFIPRNSNFILRLNNSIKKMVSEHNLTEKRKSRNRYLFILIGVVALFLIYALLNI